MTNRRNDNDLILGCIVRTYRQFINIDKDIVYKNIVIMKGRDGKYIGRIYDEDNRKIVVIPDKFKNDLEYGNKYHSKLLEKEKYYVFKGIIWSNK